MTSSFLCRLRQNTAGNTIAMMAAAIFPLSAFSGAAIDLARLYVVKSRLQQACDAGALAGRKFMTGTSLDTNARNRAAQFFNNNFRQGWFQTAAVAFTPADTGDGQVRAVASARVPMAIMGMFGYGDKTLSVECEARLDVADVDIMFVLDVTGSMACTPARSTSSCSSYVGGVTATQVGDVWRVPEEAGSRIAALRLAVVDFYNTLDNAADPSTRIRYGFVPYASAANVGYILPNSYLVRDTWTYQSRRLIGEGLQNGTASSVTIAGPTNATACTSYVFRSPASGFPATRTWGTAWNAATNTCAGTRQTLLPLWRYEPIPVDISRYVEGYSDVVNPTRLDGALIPRWTGCVEERDTTASTSFGGAPPPDLNLDLMPTSRSTRWRPMLASVVYNRSGLAPEDSTSDSGFRGTLDNNRGGFNACPKQAQRLAEMTRDDVSNYVNAADFTAHGGTYHDVGMLWGARFLNPNGPFSADTSAWANRNPPNRHIVFMTDGDMAPNQDIYGAYGYERIDRRVSGTDISSLTSRHNTRFAAICEAAKQRNITVWVVAFAQTMTTQLQACASPGRAFYAADQTQLRQAFQQIASQIAELRITR
jgi:Flp pilus assembly protein TadG